MIICHNTYVNIYIFVQKRERLRRIIISRIFYAKLLIIHLLFWLLAVPVHSIAQEIGEWKEVRDNDGIKAFVMKLPEVAMKKIKVETVTESSLSSLVSLMIDAPRNKDWVYANEFACVREKSDPFNWVYYGQSDAPWPVSDRDVVSRVHMSQNPITKEIMVVSVGEPEYECEHEDFVRIPMLHAVWRFKPLGEGRVQVSFELQLDLGGNMPAWVINLAATKGPYNSLKSFIALAKEEPYLSIHLDYIKEPQW